jgi:hypothetical protein
MEDGRLARPAGWGRPASIEKLQKFFPFFLCFPQRNSVLHSLFTTEHQFSVAATSLFKQSIASANVRCLERYGLQQSWRFRRFSRVD